MTSQSLSTGGAARGISWPFRRGKVTLVLKLLALNRCEFICEVYRIAESSTQTQQ